MCHVQQCVHTDRVDSEIGAVSMILMKDRQLKPIIDLVNNSTSQNY